MVSSTANKKDSYSKLLERNKALGGSNSSLDYHHGANSAEDSEQTAASQHKTNQDHNEKTAVATTETDSNMGNEVMRVKSVIISIDDKNLEHTKGHHLHPSSPTRTLGMERMRRSRKRSPAPKRVVSPTRNEERLKSPRSPKSPKSPKRMHRRASRERKVEKREEQKHQEKHHRHHYKQNQHLTFEERVAASAQASALAAAALAAVAARMAFPELEYSEEDMDMGDMVEAATSASQAAVEAARLLSLQARDIQKNHTTRNRRTKELEEPTLERTQTI